MASSLQPLLLVLAALALASAAKAHAPSFRARKLSNTAGELVEQNRPVSAHIIQLLPNQPGTETFTGSLDATGCYAPVSANGWGYCGPASCKDKYITCQGPATVDGVTGTYIEQGGTQYSASNCMPFLDRTSDSDLADSAYMPAGACDSSCTQQTTGVCSASFLAGVIAGDGVKYAYWWVPARVK